ncbi:MAG: M20/M25/M40 family metallo-hydrolase, partial [Acidobacteria bacterium]|nr:M20/M25/M40 family metallo-hydrolase [Acidobacteriota bacterium]
MAEVYADDKIVPAIRPFDADAYVGPVICAFIVLLALFCLYAQRPPAPVPADAPAADFSSGRAMQHLREIAKEARPVGSTEQARVREYIVGQLQGMALTTQVQEATVVGQARGASLRAGRVKNILARLPGANHDKGVLLVAHYDSVPAGPGASDNGSGVVALLETARALKAGPPLRNDVILLFSDAEEVGSLGAKAFADEHAWAKEVGLVLNFEARGNGGPSAMFETSDGNGALIGEFAASAPHPSATSLSYEIYKLLPNDTDLTVFKKAGLPGLNFAYIGGLVHYHSATDNLASVNEGSVQHQGSYALALARHFGNLDLTQLRQGNAVYFDLLGAAVIRYPAAWVVPVAALALLVFAAVVVVGRRARLLKASGVLIGFFAFLLNMIVAAVAATLVWWGVLTTNAGYRSLLLGDTYNSGTYMLAFAALIVALTAALHVWYRRRVSVENLAVGALAWWLILLVATSVLVPGASYLFAWPLLFSLLALGADFLLRGRQAPSRRAAVLTAGAVPGIVLLVPLIYMIFVALTLNVAGVVMILLV